MSAVVQNGRRRARNNADELSFEERAALIKAAQKARPIVSTVTKPTPTEKRHRFP